MATLVFDGLKRIASNDDAGICSKKFKYSLEHDSDSTGDLESVYSFQNHDTASARDTSDTDEEEYEVQSLSEVTLSEVSSGPEDCVLIENLNSTLDELGSEIPYIADLSESFSSDEDEVGRLSQKRCEKCKSECEEPFTLCLKCFRQRRTYFPPRPKGRWRKNRASPKRGDSDLGRHGSQGSSAGSQGSLARSQGRDDSLNRLVASQQGSNQEPRVNMCKCCFADPINGAFIHKNTIHTMYCYKCSIKQWRMRGRCPLCNQKLSKVAKIFPVED